MDNSSSHMSTKMKYDKTGNSSSHTSTKMNDAGPSTDVAVCYNDLTFVRFVGEGPFRAVRLMKDADGREYAVKSTSTHDETLQREHLIYGSLQRRGLSNMIPKVYNFEKIPHENVMIMEMLGTSLLDEIECKGHFSVEEALRVGRCLLSDVRKMHAAGVVHLDIALRNIVRGRAGTVCANSIYLIDFGEGQYFATNEDGLDIDREKSQGCTSYGLACQQDIRDLMESVILMAEVCPPDRAPDWSKKYNTVDEYLRQIKHNENIDYDFIESFLS